MTVHPTAIVADGAQLAAGVTVGPFCTIGSNAVIGAGTTLVSHVVVDGHTTIGEDVTLFPFCTVGMAPQDLKYRGEPTRCVIGPRTQIREHCTIHRGTVTGTGVTTVGADCLLMAVVHVAHDCELGDGVIIANNVVMGGHVVIGDGAVIGGSAALIQFVRIGRAAMVGGVSGVEADVVPFGRVVGNRARLVGLNIIGLRRRGVEKPQMHTIRAAVRDLFGTSDAVFAQRLAAVRSQYSADPLVAEILAFIDAPSRRGLIHSAMNAEEEA